jgi:hypothetical protein
MSTGQVPSLLSKVTGPKEIERIRERYLSTALAICPAEAGTFRALPGMCWSSRTRLLFLLLLLVRGL